MIHVEKIPQFDPCSTATWLARGRAPEHAEAIAKAWRDFPDLDASSRLSPHLRFGSISPRTVHHAALQAKARNGKAAKEIDVFISELVWRDFYKTILFPGR